MGKVNKYENLIKAKYENYSEEDRFSSKHQRVELLTTMRYIKNHHIMKMNHILFKYRNLKGKIS